MNSGTRGMPVTVTRTYLELRHGHRLCGAELPSGAEVRPLDHCRAATYRWLYRTTGADYHWRDRWDWTDQDIETHLAAPEIALFVLRYEGKTAGWYELASRAGPETEIAYFGLLPGFTGRGLGKALLTEAVRRARARGARRVWLHTCSLDDPAALPNYLRRGFLPFREERYQVLLPAD